MIADGERSERMLGQAGAATRGRGTERAGAAGRASCQAGSGERRLGGTPLGPERDSAATYVRWQGRELAGLQVQV